MTERSKQTFALDEIIGGAVAARVDEALEAIARSIDDPNTEPTARRELVVRMGFKPNKLRTSAEVAVDVQTRLPGRSPLLTVAFVGFSAREKRFLVREQQNDQGRLQFEEKLPASTRQPGEDEVS